MNKKFVIDENILDISKFVAAYYYKQKGINISPIKIQKSLYFLFVFWIEKFYGMKFSEILEEFENFSDKLFDVEFEAWAYGPVVKKIFQSKKEYLNFSDEKFNNIENLVDLNKKGNGYIIDFIKSTLNEINDTNDFDLVDKSHEDSAWKIAKNQGYGTKMKFEDLLRDYNNVEERK